MKYIPILFVFCVSSPVFFLAGNFCRYQSWKHFIVDKMKVNQQYKYYIIK